MHEFSGRFDSVGGYNIKAYLLAGFRMGYSTVNPNDQAPTTRGPRAQVAGQKVETDEVRIESGNRQVFDLQWRHVGISNG
jgi:hypothetical protein